MGNTVSQALCEADRQDDKPQQEPEAQDGETSSDDSSKSPEGDSGSKSESGTGNKSGPKNTGDDEEVNAKESEAARAQHSGAQASSKAGLSEPVSVRKASHEEAEANKAEHDESGGNKSSDAPDPDDEEHIQVKTVPYDRRFPATNQARNCYTRYNEYYKCIAEKDEDAPECKFYQRAYRSICPAEWVENWNTARDEGNWYGKY